MKGFSLFYIEANAICMVVFGILLLHSRFSIDRQEKQIKFNRALLAFMIYFLVDSLWAALADGLLPRSLSNWIFFMLQISMSAIIYFWLAYVLAYEQIPHRNRPLNLFAILFPFIVSTIALALNFIIAPQTLVSDTLDATPLFTFYLSLVPDIYIVAVLFHTIRRARREENRAEKRKYLLIGVFPLAVSALGLVGTMIAPQLPTFCFFCLILMLLFYIQSLELRISQDPLTQLNNRGQLQRYCAQRPNLFREDRQTVVVMMDIDRFKTINDTYGHAEGDKALLAVSAALKNVVNNNSTPSFLCRYGGDEFMLIVHPVDTAETDGIIREVRAEIQKEERAYPLSISAGYDVLRREGDTIQDCVRRADEKLYEDKGRVKAVW